MSERIVTIAAFGDSTEAHLARFALEEAGISCAVADENIIGLPTYLGAVSSVKLQVKESDVARATEVLKQAAQEDASNLSDEPQADDEEDNEQPAQLPIDSPTCPQCGSESIEVIEESEQAVAGGPLPFSVQLCTKTGRCGTCGHSWRDEPHAAQNGTPGRQAAPAVGGPRSDRDRLSLGSPLTIRHLEFVLVLFVAFAAPLYASITQLVLPWPRLPPPHLHFQAWGALLHAVSALAVLLYVLHRRGQGLRSIGLSFSGWDIPVSLLLAGAAYVAYAVVHGWIHEAAMALGGQSFPPKEQVQVPLDAGFALGTFLTVLVNPVFEESIVRGYAMSEVKRFTGSAFLAVTVSVVLQTSYHLYQGVPAALAMASTFLVFSVYYASTKRLLPVMLAHFYFNAWYLLTSS